MYQHDFCSGKSSIIWTESMLKWSVCHLPTKVATVLRIKSPSALSVWKERFPQGLITAFKSRREHWTIYSQFSQWKCSCRDPPRFSAGICILQHINKVTWKRLKSDMTKFSDDKTISGSWDLVQPTALAIVNCHRRIAWCEMTKQ